jgi:hypothetical protein
MYMDGLLVDFLGIKKKERNCKRKYKALQRQKVLFLLYSLKLHKYLELVKRNYLGSSKVQIFFFFCMSL